MHLIVGLGNPGAKYSQTRHNIGWRVIAALAMRQGISVARKEHHALTGSGLLGSEKLLLALPQTYMNLSGQAVGELVRYNRLPLENLLVVCDDLNLPLGRLRLRAEGSDGGQNGLKSIVEVLGSRSFARLRVGIGEPTREQRAERGTADYVLSVFGPTEAATANEAVARAVECIECWAGEGTEAAMSRFNRAAN